MININKKKNDMSEKLDTKKFLTYLKSDKLKYVEKNSYSKYLFDDSGQTYLFYLFKDCVFIQRRDRGIRFIEGSSETYTTLTAVLEAIGIGMEINRKNNIEDAYEELKKKAKDLDFKNFYCALINAKEPHPLSYSCLERYLNSQNPHDRGNIDIQSLKKFAYFLAMVIEPSRCESQDSYRGMQGINLITIYLVLKYGNNELSKKDKEKYPHLSYFCNTKFSDVFFHKPKKEVQIRRQSVVDQTTNINFDGGGWMPMSATGGARAKHVIDWMNSIPAKRLSYLHSMPLNIPKSITIDADKPDAEKKVREAILEGSSRMDLVLKAYIEHKELTCGGIKAKLGEVRNILGQVNKAITENNETLQTKVNNLTQNLTQNLTHNIDCTEDIKVDIEKVIETSTSVLQLIQKKQKLDEVLTSLQGFTKSLQLTEKLKTVLPNIKQIITTQDEKLKTELEKIEEKTNEIITNQGEQLTQTEENSRKKLEREEKRKLTQLKKLLDKKDFRQAITQAQVEITTNITSEKTELTNTIPGIMETIKTLESEIYQPQKEEIEKMNQFVIRNLEIE